MNPNSISLTFGSESGVFSKEEVYSFLQNVASKGEAALKERKAPSELTHFVQGKISNTNYDLDYSHTVDILDELKQKITLFKDGDLMGLFEKALGLVNSCKLAIAEPSEKQVPIPYKGECAGWELRGDLSGKEMGTFVLFSSGQYPGMIFASTVLKGNNVLTYGLKTDPSNKGGWILEGEYDLNSLKKFMQSPMPTGEKFVSIEDFVNSRIAKKRFITPLPIQRPTNFAEKTKEFLECHPYFPDFNFITAFRFLMNKAEGTYLIRNKEGDEDTKVIMYKEGEEVKSFQLSPSPGRLEGYDIGDQWYSSLSQFVYAKHDILKKYFTLSLEDVEGMDKSEKTHKDIESTPVIPEWKSSVFAEYRSLVGSKKMPLDDALQQAFERGEFEVAKWLINKGASIRVLESRAVTPNQKAQFDWFQKYLSKPLPSPETLHHYALDVGYGFKTANLLVQERYVEELNKKLNVVKVQVPSFIPVSDFEMREHLNPILPELSELWSGFLDSFDPAARQQFIEGKVDPMSGAVQISPKGMAMLENMQTKIKTYFAKHPYHTPELEDWIEQNPSEFLIVRSTGKEDTEENPNPGGNETIAYVKPTPLEISNSIAQVISSYFGIKSVTQRLMVGDGTLFKERPFTPVLIMQMITEKVNGAGSTEKNIPRSGVMFTRQNGKAEGVSLLQIGLGNNEGIVGSKVAVDTHYTDAEGNIFSIIRDKKTRYVPVQAEVNGQVRLEPVYNKNRALEQAQGLPNPVIKDMKIAADFFADKYRRGKASQPAAMDMEFTIQLEPGGDKPMVNLLQIRPLAEKEVIKPTYLDLSKVQSLSKEKREMTRTLLGGSSSVEDITNPDEAMFVDNLTQGLSRYLKTVYNTVRVKTPESIPTGPRPPKVIFTSKTAHLTSHEAIFFRKRGIVIFVVDDPAQMDRIKKMVGRATENNPIKADPQRGLLLDTSELQNKSDLLVQGFVSYPIPREISLPHGLFNPAGKDWSAAEIKTKIEILFKRYQHLNLELMEGNDYFPSTISMRELFDLAASSGNPLVAKRALGTILNRLNNDLKGTIHKTESYRLEANLPLLQIFDAATSLAERQILPALKLAPGHPNRLFPLKFLDAFIFQEHSDSVMGCVSWKTAKQVDLQEKRAIQSVAQTGAKIDSDWQLQIQKLGNDAFDEKTKRHWTEFTKNLIKASHEHPKIVELAGLLIREVVNMNLAPMWINLIFNNAWKETDPSDDKAVKVLLNLIQTYSHDKETFEWVKQNRVLLATAREQIGEWSNPKFVKKNVDAVRDFYAKTLGFYSGGTTGPFVQRFQSCDKMGRLALLGLYQEAIDVYDKTLKSISGSNEFPSDNLDKAKDFSKMLVGYFQMLQGTIHLISKPDEEVMMKHAWENEQISFDRYLSDLEQGVPEGFFSSPGPGLIQLYKDALSGKTSQKELFIARPEFNVEAIAIGSHADYSYSVIRPTTLEEFFTTIHQNLERVRKHLTTKEGLSTKNFAGTPKDVAFAIENSFREEPSDISISGTTQTVRYNIPLRQHSCAVEMQFDLNKPESGVIIRGMTFGANERDRWDKSVGYASFFGNIEGSGFSIPKGSPPLIDYQNPKNCTFSFLVQKGKDSANIWELISSIKFIFKEISFDRTPAIDYLIQDLQNKLPDKDWHRIKDGFYEDALIFSTELMKKFSGEKQQDLLLKAAKGTFEGLIKYGLDDYLRGSDIPDIPGYKFEPKYSFIPGNVQGITKSAKLTATLYLIKGLVEDKKTTEPVVISLLSNPAFKSKFPETAQALEKALSM